MSGMLVDCTNCRTPLQCPPGARAIRCALCQAITHISESRSAFPAPGHQHRLPSPPNPSQYTPEPPNYHGSKKAVICGINYRYSRYQLKGCINDANCMKYLLTSRYHFPEASILTLTEDQKNPLMQPTRYNIHMAMVWLVQGCKAGDSLLLHYSGHGSQQRDFSGEEVDGLNETICPIDFETQGMIDDNEINATIVRPLPRGVRLNAIIDACHSGTVLDLPYVCRFNSYGQFQWEDQRPRNGAWKGTNGGEAYSFSGCDDNETSADTSALSKVTSTGAMTFCFIQAIERGYAQTYGSLLTAMRNAIREVGRGSGQGVELSPLSSTCSWSGAA